jgi:hypothetical protein
MFLDALPVASLGFHWGTRRYCIQCNEPIRLHRRGLYAGQDQLLREVSFRLLKSERESQQPNG